MGCTKKITTGKRHYFEYINFPELRDERPKHEDRISRGIRRRYEKMWVKVPSSPTGTEVFVLRPITPGFILRPNGNAMGVKQMQYDRAELSRLEKEYYAGKPDIGRLFSIRHPLYRKVPYFRQIWPCKGYLLIANSFSHPESGAIKIYGTPSVLARIVGGMLRSQLTRRKNWKADARRFVLDSLHAMEDECAMNGILARDGILKVMDGYAFAVAPLKALGGMECFCFSDDINTLTKSVEKELQRKSRAK